MPIISTGTIQYNTVKYNKIKRFFCKTQVSQVKETSRDLSPPFTRQLTNQAQVYQQGRYRTLLTTPISDAFDKKNGDLITTQYTLLMGRFCCLVDSYSTSCCMKGNQDGAELGELGKVVFLN